MNEVKSGVWVNIYLSRPAASVTSEHILSMLLFYTGRTITSSGHLVHGGIMPWTLIYLQLGS